MRATVPRPHGPELGVVVGVSGDGPLERLTHRLAVVGVDQLEEAVEGERGVGRQTEVGLAGRRAVESARRKVQLPRAELAGVDGVLKQVGLSHDVPSLGTPPFAR